MSIVAHGHLQLNQVQAGMKSQKRGNILKPTAVSSWEAIIPEGEGSGFNVQTWGDMTKKYLRPITELSVDNFMKIIEETERYVKVNAKGKEKSTIVSTSDDEEATDFFDFR